MGGIGGLNKSKIDRKHCVDCGKAFEDNESKAMTRDYSGFRCVKCDEKKNGGNRLK